MKKKDIIVKLLVLFVIFVALKALFEKIYYFFPTVSKVLLNEFQKRPNFYSELNKFSPVTRTFSISIKRVKF